jgi:trehalose 6-phosphate phosphatase
MEVINARVNLNIFFNKLSLARMRALLLDYDGTLAPFRQERAKAVPYPGVREILSDLIARGKTRLVIISGRRIEDLIPLLHLKALPEIWGSHGLERLCGGNYRVAELEEMTRRGLAEVDAWIGEERLMAVSEKKPSGVAFHWRGLNQADVDRLKGKIQKKWLSTASRAGLILREFDGGLELRAAGVTKGKAIESIIGEMDAGTVVAFLGDDLTDEDGFKALGKRGLSILVQERRRETAADVWIRPPEELLAFLKRWAESGG